MRDEILKAAAERFARYGYYKTTIEDIASDLNKVKSALYYYFKNKEELFNAVMDNELDKLSASIRAGIDQSKPPKEKLRDYIISHFQLFGKLTKGYSTIIDLYFTEHDLVQKVRTKYDEMEMDTIGSLIKEGNETRVFAVEHIQNTSLAILAAIKGTEQEYVSGKAGKNIKIISETMADILVQGISNPYAGRKEK